MTVAAAPVPAPRAEAFRFPSALSELVYYRTYSRWIESEGRRETWPETVRRYVEFARGVVGRRLGDEDYAELEAAIVGLHVMPSMRLLWSAGAAADATHAAAYNCAFVAPRTVDDLAEIMYLLMCGVGVGFSVEDRNVRELPVVRPRTGRTRGTHVVRDTKEGWCDALKEGLRAWYMGDDLDFDVARVRPAGARLRTMGGRSSGPETLTALLDDVCSAVRASEGARLGSVQVYDIVCKIGQLVGMGGMRRSALISLSDLNDVGMRAAKSGDFYAEHPERATANNSVAYDERPSAISFLAEWAALAAGGSGERGIYNRGALPEQLPARRWPLFEPGWATSGTNPCGEIVLRSKQFCNLTEVVARPFDTERTLLAKVRVAAILGTYQSILTDWPYLSGDWSRNCEEERLLGVSITGHWDCPVVRDPAVLRTLRECAVETNHAFARRFGVAASTAVTCVKPSGSVSELVDAAPGLHPRYAPHYLRRIRLSELDPLLPLLDEHGLERRPEPAAATDGPATWVFEFPVRAPAHAVVRRDLDALVQLEHWKTVKLHYTEHNPSVTVQVGESEWIAVASWLYENWDVVGGLTFAPRDGGVHELAPFEEISREEYERRAAVLPWIDFSRLAAYEAEDRTGGPETLACVGGACLA